jgi:hypothetical protein
MDMHPPTDLELETYLHVFFRFDLTWDPSHLYQEYTIADLDINVDDLIPSFGHGDVNSYGEFYTRECATHVSSQSQTAGLEEYIDNTLLLVHLHKVTPAQHDFKRLKPNFGFAPSKRIQKTIENTTQFCRLDARLPLRKHFKITFPGCQCASSQ